MESQMNKRDIIGREEISELIAKFYDKVRGDEMLSPVFRHVDWEHHTPVIIDFWAMVLLGSPDYKGNPFQKHLPLKIGREHFERWLNLFAETVDENFAGEKSEEAKARALNIARIFQFKLGLHDQKS
jgi:hemoglobin